MPEQSLGDAQPKYPLDVFLCRACGHVQLLDVIDAGVLYNDYIYTTTNSPGLPEHFQRYADEVLGWVTLPKGSLIVDIGSNDGTLLRAFKNRRMQVLGVEPARHIAKNATSSGIGTVPAFFDVATADQIKAKHGHAGLITANNIFANVDDLGELASGIRSLLAQDGVLISKPATSWTWSKT